MSYLAKLKHIENEKNKNNIPDSVPTKPTKVPFDGFVGAVQGKNKKKLSNIAAITPEQIQKIQTWLSQIGEQEEDQHIVLGKCRKDVTALEYFLKQADDYASKKRREKVIAMLKAHPSKKRAYSSDASADSHNVILTVAIRGAGTFEMLIPQDKYNPFLLAEMLEKESVH